jgi:hypothetical protein
LRRPSIFDTGYARRICALEVPMKTTGSVLALIVAAWLCPSLSYSLTVDEIINLKRAGVSDSTIELLIKRSGDARSAGVWKQDGWIVHSTETRFPDEQRFDGYDGDYPIAGYADFSGDSGGKDHRRKHSFKPFKPVEPFKPVDPFKPVKPFKPFK